MSVSSIPTDQTACPSVPTGNWIGGRWQPARSGRTADNINPADTTQTLHQVPDSAHDDVVEALDAAAWAQDQWAATPAPQRGALLRRAGDLLAARQDQAARLMSLEMGKPIAEARGEVARSVDLLRYYASAGWRLEGVYHPATGGDSMLLSLPVPLGVVSLITPWNFPSAIPVWKAAPALIAGNTVVLKPATLAPGSALLLGEVFQQAGLPAGVLNIVCGRGSVMGDALVTDRRIRAVSFTGSCGVGRAIYARAATPERRVGLEMGGKNPLIVTADADIDLAVDLAVNGAMGSAGQKCTATSRAIVDRRILTPFTDQLLGRVEAMRVGNPLDPDNDLGPVGDHRQLQSILQYIQIGCEQDQATLAVGGRRLTGDGYDRGFFIEPTVFTDVHPDMRIAQEEIFGPVLGVIGCDGFEEAMRIANDVEFGLSAAICTRDMALAEQFTRRIEAGLVHVNSTTTGAQVHLPFGGMKGSTSGFREMGTAGIDFFTTTKTIYHTNIPGESK
jgi:aldehyde dehydrogenase (NAD+)